jgi:ABC-2 type transport system permease protein
MNPTVHAVRIGLRRGWTEFRQLLASPQEFVFDVTTAGVILVVLYFLQDTTYGETSLSLATLALPGVVGMGATVEAGRQQASQRIG